MIRPVKFEFGIDSSWYPTMDLSCYPGVENLMGQLKCEETTLLGRVNIYAVLEECVHRWTMLETKVRARMSWMEALSNFELIGILDDAVKTSTADRNFRLVIPLDPEQTPELPTHLKIKINDLKRACRIIELYGKSSELFVEAYALRFMQNLFYGPKADLLLEVIKQKKLKRNKRLAIVYPKFEQVYDNLGFDDLTPLIQCVLNPKWNDDTPPLTLMQSFDSFNERSAHEVAYRFRRLLTKLSKTTFRDVETFMHVAESYNLGFDTTDPDVFLKPYLFSAEIIAGGPSAHRYNEVKRDINFLLVDLPSFQLREPNMVQSFRRQLEQDNLEKTTLSKLDDILFMGTAIANVHYEGDKRVFHLRVGLPTEMGNSFSAALSITFLKYFLLNPIEPFPIFGLSDSCQKCPMTEPSKLGQIEPEKQCFLCPCSVLENIRIKYLNT